MNSEQKIRVGIVDDHQIVIDGLVSLLKEQSPIHIVVTATSGKEMLSLLQQHTIDILLTDVMMPEMNGKDLAVAVKNQFPAIKIMALSMSDQGDVAEEMIENASIAGYLLKQTGKAELLEAIKKVYNGGQYFQDKILEQLEKQSHIKKNTEHAHLTRREIEIISLIEKNLSNKQIADSLCIAVHTVETHRKNILRKTGTNNMLSLVKWAYENKVL